MLDNTSKWSHARGNTVVPSRWQATVWARHRGWSEDGTWDKIHTTLMAQADAAGLVDWSVNVDSTINRAHQHGTNLPRGGTIKLQEFALRA